MAYQDVYISFETFFDQVIRAENGAIRHILLASEGELFKKYGHLYFLPYPHNQSYLAKCIEEAESDEWQRRNKEGTIEHIADLVARINNNQKDELPLYTEKMPHYNWEEFYESRLEKLFKYSLSKEELIVRSNSIIVIDSERTMGYQFNKSKDFFIIRPNIQGYIVSRMFHGISKEDAIKEIDELESRGELEETMDSNLYLIKDGDMSNPIFLGDENEYYPRNDHGGNATMTLARIMKEITEGESTIYPFDWIGY